ncbi:unnamed protein product [Mucor fragilis]
MSSSDDPNIDLYDDFVDENSELAYWMEVAELESLSNTEISLAEELSEEAEEQEAKRVNREIDLIASNSIDGSEDANVENVRKDDGSGNNKSVEVGKPDFLGPFDNIQAVVDKLLAFAAQHHFGIRTLKSNNEKGTQIKKNVTYVCRYSGTPQIKKYIPKSDQKAHKTLNPRDAIVLLRLI